MKKLILSLVALWFVTAGSGIATAAEPTPVKTPMAKSMHHKKSGHKMAKKTKGKKAMKPKATPTPK